MCFPNVGHESEPFTCDGADEPLRFAAVAARLPRCSNPAVKRRSRNDAAGAHHADQVVPADDAGAIADKEYQEVENLRLDADEIGPTAELSPVSVEGVVREKVGHAVGPPPEP